MAESEEFSKDTDETYNPYAQPWRLEPDELRLGQTGRGCGDRSSACACGARTFALQQQEGQTWHLLHLELSISAPPL